VALVQEVLHGPVASCSESSLMMWQGLGPSDLTRLKP
jgi:hypothetical protein